MIRADALPFLPFLLPLATYAMIGTDSEALVRHKSSHHFGDTGRRPSSLNCLPKIAALCMATIASAWRSTALHS